MKALLLVSAFCAWGNVAFSQGAPKPTATKKPVVIPENVQIAAGPKTGDQGVVTFIYRGKKVHYITVRAEDGNVWLQQNLGSKTYADDYKDARSYGDLFQWGRWDDGHQAITPDYTSATLPEPNNPAGLKKTGDNPFYYKHPFWWWIDGKKTDTWTAATPKDATAENGCDPCRAIGAGWRLPTYEELKHLIETAGITNESTGWHSAMKFSLGGFRKHLDADITEYRGYSAVYWTSSVGESGNNGIGYGLVTGQFGYFPRGQGNSIRCILSKQ